MERQKGIDQLGSEVNGSVCPAAEAGGGTPERASIAGQHRGSGGRLLPHCDRAEGGAGLASSHGWLCPTKLPAGFQALGGKQCYMPFPRLSWKCTEQPQEGWRQAKPQKAPGRTHIPVRKGGPGRGRNRLSM